MHEIGYIEEMTTTVIEVIKNALNLVPAFPLYLRK